MNIPFFDLTRQSKTSEVEIFQAITEVQSSGTFILSQRVATFETEFAKYLGIDHCITCGNGTDALEMSLEALGIKAGDEVLLPSFGWISPYMAVKRCGATPVLVEVDPITGNILSDDISNKITTRSKAVIAIHLFGNPCDIIPIKTICDAKGLFLIEDCAQAHGAAVAGQKCGSFGDVAIFSFYPTKNLGAWGDGGAVVTNNVELAGKIRSLRHYCKQGDRFQGIGRNSRLDEIQAAILLVKLKYLDKWNERRITIARRYQEVIGCPINASSVYHQFTLKVTDRAEFQKKLLNKGIGTAVHYPFVVSSVEEDGRLTNAQILVDTIVSLPIFPELMEEEIFYICEHLDLLRKYIL
ncbi:MAG: dTDP-4-amino-4,6-dideoxygalactose transaminase [Marinoscillum sp.]|jgi:dTDP-4-amino-4,6-dideoxygalactose transaminase